MPAALSDPAVAEAIRDARNAAARGATRSVEVAGREVSVPYPYPSPVDWRDSWIYFLMLDRFGKVDGPPAGPWNQRFDFRHGGTFAGVTAQLDYLAALGVTAIWLSPVVKNVAPPTRFNYHGYGAQNVLALDERFASDGTRPTAERELTELVDGAHARGIRVVLDIVLNHVGRVFDYVRDGQVVDTFTDPALLDGPPGTEAPIRWLDGTGSARADWPDDLAGGVATSPDDAVYPTDLRRPDFFRRRGTKVSDEPGPSGFAVGDFADLRQLVFEYLVSDQESALWQAYGPNPVLTVLVRAYSYLIARYDIDGLRIDTAKYVSALHLEWFGNAMREFGYSIGKRNLLTFGEIYDDEETIANFVGRNSSDVDSFGIDSALDFPLFFVLPDLAKGFGDVAALRTLYARRIAQAKNLLSSHGDAGQYFVGFLDNHDQRARIRQPGTPDEQVRLAIALLFSLPGIPSLYYGTEADLAGTVDASGHPDLSANESTREALWGKPGAFDTTAPGFAHVAAIAAARMAEPALRYGRLYFREVSGNGHDFGHSSGPGGVVAFSRILADREVTVVANCHPSQGFAGSVLRDPTVGRGGLRIAYSNADTAAESQTVPIRGATFWVDGASTGTADVVAVPVVLQPMEIQILVPDA